MEPAGSGGEGYKIERSYLALCLCGSTLDPAEVTNRLGIEPSVSITAAESIEPREGVWLRQFGLSGVTTLEERIDALISDLRGSPEVWYGLSRKAKITLVCSLYPGNWNQGARLSARQLKWLGDRQIELGIDVHSWAGRSPTNKEPWR